MPSKFRESSTYKLVLVSLAVVNWQWLSGAVTASLTDYATATAAILAIWLGREWRQAHYKHKDDPK
jgi:hypothetical protein